VNLHGEYHVVGGDGGVTTWPIIGRYGATPSPSKGAEGRGSDHRR
jgi:hypothetical protein